MSDPGKAVFLSYASQDTEAVKRICEALRAAGVEVWFDQNELVGGDAWDSKIRKQIKDCALLIPIISASTQARTEGYFRLEWRLADQRTHLMAKGRPFLLPVVIDDTRDAEAHVPDSFTEVQWTRLPGGEGGAAFAARVRKLLGGEPGAGSRESAPAGPKVDTQNAEPKTDIRRLGRLWWALPVLGVAIALALVLKEARKDSPPKAEAPAAPLSEARKLANQAMQLLEDPNFTRETSWLADELCQRALALDAGDAEVWAVAAFASHNLFSNTYDTSAGRREKARSQAARASQLDPQSVRAALAVARCLEGTDNDAELRRILKELHRRAPADQEVLFSLVRAEGVMGNETAVLDHIRKFRALPRTGLFPLTLWFEELRLRTLGRYADAEAILDEMLADSGVLRGAYYEKLNLLMRSWHDLAAAAPFIEKIPARFRQEPAFGSAIAYYWLWRAEPEKALQALAQVPQDYFEEYAAREPKGYLTGWAHAIAKRPAAALAEWRAALALVEERLKTDARNTSLLNQRALLLALTGQREAAREAWQLRVELGGEQNPVGLEAETQVLVALNEPEAALAAIEREWSRRKPMGRVRALPVLRYHPAYVAIRGDPRLQRILKEDEAELHILKEQQTGPALAKEPTTVSSAALAKDDKSVAVLAFANLSSDKANEYFSDGISEELLNVLGRVPGLRVAAPMSAFSFKGKNVSAQEIGQKLNVAYLVNGSVRRAGPDIRVVARLSRAETDEQIWTEKFDGEAKNVFALQDEIAGKIAAALSLKLGASARIAKPIDPEAYRLYLEGRHFWSLRTFGGFDRAEAALKQAVALEPESALIRAGLAELYATRGWYRAQNAQDPGDNFALASAEAERALVLDPENAQAILARASIAIARQQSADAAALLQRAFALAPNDAAALNRLGDLMVQTGRLDAAVDNYQRGMQLDPLSVYHVRDVVRQLLYARRYREVIKTVDRFEAGSTRDWRMIVGRAQALVQTGKTEQAAAELKSILPSITPDDFASSGASMAELVFSLRVAQCEPESEALAKQLLDRHRPGTYLPAMVLAARGRMDQALPLMVPFPVGSEGRLFWSAIFDPVRDEPRFLRKIEEFGVAAEYKVARESLARMLLAQGAKK